MSEPTHVFIGVRHGRVFAIAATVETVSTWLEEEGADLIQRVPLAESRTLLFQPLPMLAEIDTLRSENERLRAALHGIAHTFTEDSHGGMTTMSASYYQEIARAVLSEAQS